MFKAKLQQLCDQKKWVTPKYLTAKDGQDHDPRFQSSVTVNGQSFVSQGFFKSIKKAQDDAAKIAFEFFSSPSPVPPSPGIGASSCGSIQVDRSLSAGETLPRKVRKLNETCQENGLNAMAAKAKNQDKFGGFSFGSTEADVNLSSGRVLPIKEPVVNRNLQEDDMDGSSAITRNDDRFRETQHLSKNNLQIYAQKNNLPLPVYSCQRIGPPHASRFKCWVTINGQTYESSDFFSTVKDAEHAAAKAALMSLLSDKVEVDASAVKILLQELAQKEGYRLPIYRTRKSGEDHKPVFISTVEIGVDCFPGGEARTKKQAEINAAMVAYTTIKSRKSNATSGLHSLIDQGPSDQVKEVLPCSSSSFLSDIVAYCQQNFQPKLDLPSDSVEEMAASSLADEIISLNIKQLLEISALCRKGLLVESSNANVAYPEGSVASHH